MLSSLHIENIAVIKTADIDFKKGFNALTGETGAGKSILLGSISLIMGARPSKEMIRSGEDKALVTAVFSDFGEAVPRYLEENGIASEEDGCVYISRAIQSDGRAQTKVNGRTVPVSVQKELAQLLINIHGQHDSIALLSPASHIEYLDRYAGKPLYLKLDMYKAVFARLNEYKRQIAELSRDSMEKERLIEILKYQISDIDSYKLKPGEEEALEARKKAVSNSEKIMKQSRIVVRALLRNEKAMPAYELIERAVSAIISLKEYLPKADEYIEKLTDFQYEIEDIAETVEQSAETDYDDPEAELDKIESRLDAIKKLEKKYGPDIQSVLEYRSRIAKQLDDMEFSDEKLSELKIELAKIEKESRLIADEITALRKDAAGRLEDAITRELEFLDMPKVRFSVRIDEKDEPGADGADDVEFLISANQGEPLKPISKIASGGELSRIMLALKSVNVSSGNRETLIFDEIDAGISGATSQKIGIRLRKLAESNQVICVTHSAQVAATANTQYLIKKQEQDGRASTEVTELDFDGRLREIARIMGGMQMTDSLIKTARELLEEYNKA